MRRITTLGPALGKKVPLLAMALFVIASPSNINRRNKGEALARREKKAAELSNFKFRLVFASFYNTQGRLTLLRYFAGLPPLFTALP